MLNYDEKVLDIIVNEMQRAKMSDTRIEHSLSQVQRLDITDKNFLEQIASIKNIIDKTPLKRAEKDRIIKQIKKYYNSIKDNTNIEISGEVKGALVSGVIYGNVSNASTLYGSDKFSTPRGHGFAAEQANHLYDKISNADFLGQGKVQIVGEAIDPNTGRIVKNGADRILNGTSIQTKYCNSGGKCISECFEGGKLKYINSDGTPMQIEVPSDKYEAALQAMENRIKKGEVPGVTDPKEAENIVRKGHFTYEQAKNIAKAGTVEIGRAHV